MFNNVNTLLRTLSLVCLIGIGGWWTMHLRKSILEHERQITSRDERIVELASNLEKRDEQIAVLDVKIEKKEAQIVELGEDLKVVEENLEIAEENLVLAEEEIEKLGLSLRLIKLDHRMAELEVLEQRPIEGRVDEDGEPIMETTVRFTELNQDGEPLGEPVEATIEGTRVYIESLVIKFDDRYVEAGDHLRGTSVVLFKSLFGRDQKPSEGVPIDNQGAQPRIYGDEDGPHPLHAELWEQFWEYANDPQLARERGVRAMQGEAPFMELRKGKVYRVDLRSSGGLTIQSE